MLSVRWSEQAVRDLDQVATFWAARDPERTATVLDAIWRRVHWLADGPVHLGISVAGLPANQRYYLERRYGYKIYYRIVGDSPEALLILRIRNARQRPLNPDEIE